MHEEINKIVRFYKAGDASVLRLENAVTQEPSENEIELNVEAIGLNRAEVVFRRGDYFEKPRYPSRIGYEAAGVITKLGANVKTLNVGDRVSTIPAFSMSQYGVYGEKIIVPARAVVHYPDRLTPEEGTSIWMQYLTAYGALIEVANIGRNDTVLVTAASSSVGVAALQIANNIGARTIALTTSPSKSDFLYRNGADYVVLQTSDDLETSIMHHSEGRGASIIFDPIGGPQLQTLANVAAPGATIFQYGALDSSPTPYPLDTCIAKGLSIRGYTMFELVNNPKALQEGINYVRKGIDQGSFNPQVDGQKFTLANIANAHQYMESNMHMGKIVVTVP